MNEKMFQTVLAQGLKYLATRPRSLAEISTYLDRKFRAHIPEEDDRKEVFSAVIERLTEYGYVNDERFAEQFVQGTLGRQAVGKRKLAQSLSQRKVEKETAQQVLTEVFSNTSEADVMEQAIQKYVQSNGMPSDPQDMKRLMARLLRRGFEYSLISTRLRALARQAKLEAIAEELEEGL